MRADGHDPVTRAFALWPAKVIHVPPYVWQIFTYMWLHDPAHVFHILFNMLVLWMLGGPVEAGLGRRQFWSFYILCGLAGGICALAAGLFKEGLDPTQVILGASGSVFGVLVAFALMYPDAVLLFMFIFPMRARTAAIILAVIEIVRVLQAQQYVPAIAHLSGMVTGYLLLKAADPLRYLRIRIAHRWAGRPRFRRTRAPRRRNATMGDDALMQELDRVLDKIHREGIASLTSREKEVLRRASERDGQ